MWVVAIVDRGPVRGSQPGMWVVARMWVGYVDCGQVNPSLRGASMCAVRQGTPHRLRYSQRLLEWIMVQYVDRGAQLIYR